MNISSMIVGIGTSGDRAIGRSGNLEIWKSGNLEILEMAPDAGLCASCAHVNVIVTERGSTFYLCARSKSDPRFPRYPRLPVLACIGYDEKSCTRSSPRD
jgi:hypothetical protein